MLELMLAVAILGIVATLGMPNLSQTVQNAHVRANATSLHSYLAFARRYALTHHVNVQLCQRPKSGALGCEANFAAGRAWDTGWIVFVDTDRDNTVHSDEIIKIMPPLTQAHIRFNQRGRLRFFADGSARSAGFYICSPSAKTERYVSILHSGRVRITDTLSEQQRALCKSS